MNDQVASPTRAYYGKSGDERRRKTKALMNKTGKAITDAVGSALSAPARALYGMKGAKATSDANVMREARKYKGAPNFSSKGPTDAFKVRTMADAARMRRGAKPIY